MQEQENKKETSKDVSTHWKKEYTLVVVFNILYVLWFYFLMKTYS
jgi:hypothetical protein